MSVRVLVGPPGAGCSAVAQALDAAGQGPCLDLGQSVAQELGVQPELALVAVGEERYRQAETAVALRLLERLVRGGGVLALGSGCLEDPQVRAALAALQADGGQVVALLASVRRLATRNGLDAPRSIALGTVHHSFTLMLREREAACRELADLVVDTTDTSPQEAAALILG